MPAATPSGCAWVVGTLTDATSARVAASTATTSVNVPPTSMPMRSVRPVALGRGIEIDAHDDRTQRDVHALLAGRAIEQGIDLGP